PAWGPVLGTGRKPSGTMTDSQTVSASVATATSSVSVWCRRVHVSMRPYIAIIPSKNRPVAWYRRPCSSACSALRSRAHIIGVSVSDRSEEHTSELQSRENLVCRLLLEKKNTRH